MTRKTLFFTLIILSLAGAALTGCEAVFNLVSPGQAVQETEIDEALMARGREVYLGQYCGTCHQLAEVETRGRFGPAHDNAAGDAEMRLADPNYSGSATTAGEYLYESIVAPDIYIVPGYEATRYHMPPYFHIPQDDIAAMVYLLEQQRGQ